MQVLNIFHVLIAIAMVAFILLQRGPGATAGAAFGSGASGTVFGSRGAGSFMSRSTWVLATLFCLISLIMAVVVSRIGTEPDADLGVIGTPTAVEAPVTGANDVPVMDDGTSETDLPPIGALDDSATDAANTVESISDLPVIDSTTGTPVEENGSGDSGSEDAGSNESGS